MKKITICFIVLSTLISCFVQADTNDRLRTERENRERLAQQNKIESAFATADQKMQIQNILNNAIFDLANQLGTTVHEHGTIEINGAHFADVETKLSNGTICNLAWSTGSHGEFGIINCATERNEKLTGSFNSDGRLNQFVTIQF